MSSLSSLKKSCLVVTRSKKFDPTLEASPKPLSSSVLYGRFIWAFLSERFI